QVLAFLVAEDESAPALADVGATSPSTPAISSGATDARRRSEPGARGKAISPRARRTAAELEVDWTGLTGTGSQGRIRERDVRAAASAPGAASAARLIPHTAMRRTIAARMVAGVTLAAPVTLTTKVDATALVRLRTSAKEAASSG